MVHDMYNKIREADMMKMIIIVRDAANGIHQLCSYVHLYVTTKHVEIFTSW